MLAFYILYLVSFSSDCVFLRIQFQAHSDSVLITLSVRFLKKFFILLPTQMCVGITGGSFLNTSLNPILKDGTWSVALWILQSYGRKKKDKKSVPRSICDHVVNKNKCLLAARICIVRLFPLFDQVLPGFKNKKSYTKWIQIKLWTSEVVWAHFWVCHRHLCCSTTSNRTVAVRLTTFKISLNGIDR